MEKVKEQKQQLQDTEYTPVDQENKHSNLSSSKDSKKQLNLQTQKSIVGKSLGKKKFGQFVKKFESFQKNTPQEPKIKLPISIGVQKGNLGIQTSANSSARKRKSAANVRIG